MMQDRRGLVRSVHKWSENHIGLGLSLSGAFPRFTHPSHCQKALSPPVTQMFQAAFLRYSWLLLLQHHPSLSNEAYRAPPTNPHPYSSEGSQSSFFTYGRFLGHEITESMSLCAWKIMLREDIAAAALGNCAVL